MLGQVPRQKRKQMNRRTLTFKDAMRAVRVRHHLERFVEKLDQLVDQNFSAW